MKKSAILLFAVAAAFSTACTSPPSDACVKYVDCQNAYVESYGGLDVDLSTYESGGECWDSQTAADACTTNCENAVEQIVSATENTEDGAPDGCE